MWVRGLKVYQGPWIQLGAYLLASVFLSGLTKALNSVLEAATKLESPCLLPRLKDRCTPSILVVSTAGVDVLSCEETPCALER